MIAVIAALCTALGAQDDALARAESLRLSGRLVEARAEFEKLLAQHPDDAQVLESLGVIDLTLGQFEQALPRLQQAAAASPNIADHHYNLGIALAQLKRYELALAAFRRSLALDPGHANAHHNLAHTLINQGALEDALIELEQAVKLQPGFAESHYLIALALAQMPRDAQRTTRAKQEIATALKLDPKHAGALHVRGLLEMRDGDASAAIATLRAAVALKPDWAEPYYALGTALVRSGARDEGVSTLQFFADLERFQRSLKSIDRLIELNPRSPAHHFRAAQLFRERGLNAPALQALKRVLELDPRHLDAKLEMGAILIDERQAKRAAALLEEVLRERPGEAQARMHHARALASLGQLDAARRELEQCVTAEPAAPLPRYHLAQVLDQLGLTAEAKAAREAYERLVRHERGRPP